MVDVYIWDNPEHTGHASIAVEQDVEYIQYVSFHPNFSNYPKLPRDTIIANNRRAHKNFLDLAVHKYIPFYSKFAEDKKVYGDPVSSVKINSLDEKLILSYLRDGFDEDHPYYSLLTHNCSTVVAALLLLGHHEYLTDASLPRAVFAKLRHLNAVLYKDSSSESRNYHHRRFEQLADGVEPVEPAAYIAAKRARNKPAMIFAAMAGAFDLVRRAALWTPGDVFHLALCLRDHPNG